MHAWYLHDSIYVGLSNADSSEMLSTVTDEYSKLLKEMRSGQKSYCDPQQFITAF